MSRGHREHEEVEELMAAAALGGLDEQAQVRLAALRDAHGPDCVPCNELQDGFEQTAAGLAMSLPPRRVSPAAADRLMAAVREPETHTVSELASRRRERRVPPVRAAVAAAAAVALLAGGAAIGYAVHQPSTDEAPASSALGELLSRPGARLVSFPVTAGQRLALVFRPGDDEGWLVGARMPEPAQDHVYELWFQPSGGAAMHPAGTFTPSNAGSVRAMVRLGQSFDALAVSVEPAGGSKQPTTEPIMQLKV